MNESQFPYKLRIKLGEDEFEFQSPDKESLEKIGLKLLEKTFGRYQEQKESSQDNI